MTKRGWLFVVVVVASVACGKKEDKPPAPATGSGSGAPAATNSGSGSPAAKATDEPKQEPKPDPKAEPPKLAVKANGKDLTIVSQFAFFWPRGLTVKLFSKPKTCSDINDEPDMVSFEVLSGPGGKYFVGQSDSGRFRADGEDVLGYASSITVEPFEAKKDAHVKGTIAVDWKQNDKEFKITGPFDATICNDPDTSRKKLPETADAPLAGTIATKKFTGKSAVAWLKTDGGTKVDYVEKVFFFDKPRTCKDFFDKRSEALVAEDFGHQTKVPQGASFMFGNSTNAGDGWIKFDTLELKDGGTISGSLATTYSDPGSDAKEAVDVAGTFTGTVCK